jgi:hypothetical protein
MSRAARMAARRPRAKPCYHLRVHAARAGATQIGFLEYQPPFGEGFPYPENQSAGLRPALRVLRGVR